MTLQKEGINGKNNLIWQITQTMDRCKELLIFICFKMFADSRHIYQKSSRQSIVLVLFVSEEFWQQVYPSSCFQFSSVQSLSHVQLCDPMNHSTPGLPVHHQLQGSLKLTPIESVVPYSHLILCHPLLLLPPIPPSISLFQWVNSSHEVAKGLEFQL